MIDEQKEQTEQTEIVNVEQTPVQRKWCIVGIIGFCVSVLAALIVLSAILMLVIDANLGTVIIFIFTLYLGGIVGVAGCALSIVGLVLSVKRKLRGRVFAIVGIALCVILVILLIIFVEKM